jgi:hypothetical protein
MSITVVSGDYVFTARTRQFAVVLAPGQSTAANGTLSVILAELISGVYTWTADLVPNVNAVTLPTGASPMTAWLNTFLATLQAEMLTLLPPTPATAIQNAIRTGINPPATSATDGTLSFTVKSTFVG